MEKLSMCRICLAADVRLCSVASNLQDMYEKLTELTFKTEDNRPVVACYICHARLRNCYKLWTRCLQSHEVLAQMLSSNMEMPQKLASTNTLRAVAVVHLSMGYEPQEPQINTERHIKKKSTKIIDDGEHKQEYTTGVYCRICLAADVRLCSVASNLQDMYEKLTPAREDRRPVVACYICHARLWNCYKLRASCLQGDELLTQMLSNNVFKREDQRPQVACHICHARLRNCYKLRMSCLQGDELITQMLSSNMEMSHKLSSTNALRAVAVVHLSMGYEPQEPQINTERHIKEEAPVIIDDGDVKQEYTIDIKTEAQDEHSAQTDGDNQYSHSVPLNRLKREPIYAETGCVVYEQTEVDHASEIPYMCQVCKKCFADNSYLSIHMLSHADVKPYKCKVCKKSFSNPTNLKKHMRTHNGVKPYICDVCKKSFNQSCNLKHHMLTHTGEKPYMCDVCQKCFTQKSYLRFHMRIHTGEKPYMCEVCKKCFSQTSNLNHHMRIHIGDKKYICQVCKIYFSDHSYLKLHMRSHADKKPFMCDVCKKCFNQRIRLKRHLRTHGEKRYSCDVCKRRFYQSGNLKHHMLTHTGEKPYMCDVCKKCFSLTNTLKCHMRTHTGEKPYKCDVCKKRFSQKFALTSHTRRHTGEKPYMCDICKERFRYHCSFKKHLHTHCQ